MTDFAARIARMKPGSLTTTGGIIDIYHEASDGAPCWIPANLKPARKQALGDAGWCVCPVSHWPSMLPKQGVACVVRRDWWNAMVDHKYRHKRFA